MSPNPVRDAIASALANGGAMEDECGAADDVLAALREFGWAIVPPARVLPEGLTLDDVRQSVHPPGGGEIATPYLTATQKIRDAFKELDRA